jgi:hypothetical protein
MPSNENERIKTYKNKGRDVDGLPVLCDLFKNFHQRSLKTGLIV